MLARWFPIVNMWALCGFLWCGQSFAQTAEQNTARRHIKAGMEQIRNSNFKAAQESFEEAIRYDDANGTAHLGLGIALFQQRDDSHAERELNRAAVLNPGEAAAYEFLGEISYRKDDFETAAFFWGKAVDLNPADAGLRARLDRIRREHTAEKDFNRDVTSHFLIKYEGREKIEAGKVVLRILETAYGDIGRALSFYPDREIKVILYSNEQFQEVTEAPGWSGALFDGKIRVPIGGIEQETPGLRRILYHEYTHAVVRTITPRCPTWLNEGLAQYFEGREISARQRSALDRIVKEGKLPRLAHLEGSFMGLGQNQAAYAYLFSLSAVRYLIDSAGIYRVKGLLEELARGADTDKAFRAGILLSYEEFERGWQRSFD
ncbi:MAG TPA: tetratricopeptide repeat protein [Nitrospirota bacterium]|nr:tetratricopeptide repeat protein [Nitrospirota bacterium]